MTEPDPRQGKDKDESTDDEKRRKKNKKDRIKISTKLTTRIYRAKMARGRT